MPTEWDEADLAYRIREAGWKIATCGYERLGGYEHLGSSTLGELSDAYKARVLKNGLLFHQRWSHLVDPRPCQGPAAHGCARPATQPAGFSTVKMMPPARAVRSSLS